METTVLRVLVIMTSVCSLSAKHVHIKEGKSWPDAQQYCQMHHTDLSPITSPLEEWVFNKTATEVDSGWIGLYKDERGKWRWSGGGEYVPYIRMHHKPSLESEFGHVFWNISGWHTEYKYLPLNFFCLNLIAVDVKLTWEEALLYCREKHTDLTSLLSETEILLAQTQLRKVPNYEQVWIGMRYLGDRWWWMNGLPVTTWHQDLCPKQKGCGALTKDGHLNTFDCQEKLYFICQ